LLHLHGRWFRDLGWHTYVAVQNGIPPGMNCCWVTSRRRYQAGLAFPPIHDWANFICEACLVRGILQRKLTGPDDWQLLALEQMGIIDMAHYWAANTHKTYGTKLQILRNFGTTYGFTVLRSTPLLRPPDSPEIPIMWLMGFGPDILDERTTATT
jgi:hypothetical protein